MGNLAEIKLHLKFLHLLKILPRSVRSIQHIMTSQVLLDDLPCHVHVHNCDNSCHATNLKH